MPKFRTFTVTLLVEIIDKIYSMSDNILFSV